MQTQTTYLKKLLFSLLLWLSCIGALANALVDIWPTDSILTRDPIQAVDVENVNDPIRDGTYGVIANEEGYAVEWIVDVWQIDSHNSGINTAEDHVMSILKRIINWALWMLWLIALIYLLYHGFLMVTAAGDDAQFKKWTKWLKYAAIALWWIALSRFIVSFIMRLIATFVAPTGA